VLGNPDPGGKLVRNYHPKVLIAYQADGDVVPGPRHFLVQEEAGPVAGETVVDLRVSTSDGCDVLNNFVLFNFLPIWPGCVPATVTGDIVRRRTRNDASSRMRELQ